MVSRKISKTIGLLRKLQIFLPRAALITIYKAFIRTHLDYGEILYDQAYMSFHQNLESIQCNACLAIRDIRDKRHTLLSVLNNIDSKILE